MSAYRIIVTTRSIEGDETHERGAVDEWEAAHELRAERMIHDLAGWSTRMGIGRVVCWKGTTERIIEARKEKA